MDLDPILLARLQFAFTISFHIIFPSFTIGLSAYIATLSVMWLRTEEVRYRRLARFWTRIFAVSFAMGVVSGIVLSYELGTNWSRFSVVTGNVLGPLLGYEVLAAFFLEATFLGVLLFGVDRVPPWLHTLAAIAVALGTALSAFWILAANSWMHTPAGHEVRDGIAYPLDWLAIVFNPSFPYRFAHMVTAAYLTTAFVVLAVGARLLLAGRHDEEAKTMLRMAIGMIAMIAAGLVGLWLLWGGRLFTQRWYLKLAAHGWWIGFVAVLAGWTVTETGRQPWVATGILRTAQAASPVGAHTVATTLALFVVVYGIVFATGIYYINRLIARGPDAPGAAPPRAWAHRPLAAGAGIGDQ